MARHRLDKDSDKPQSTNARLASPQRSQDMPVHLQSVDNHSGGTSIHGLGRTSPVLYRLSPQPHGTIPNSTIPNGAIAHGAYPIGTYRNFPRSSFGWTPGGLLYIHLPPHPYGMVPVSLAIPEYLPRLAPGPIQYLRVQPIYQNLPNVGDANDPYFRIRPRINQNGPNLDDARDPYFRVPSRINQNGSDLGAANDPSSRAQPHINQNGPNLGDARDPYFRVPSRINQNGSDLGDANAPSFRVPSQINQNGPNLIDANDPSIRVPSRITQNGLNLGDVNDPYFRVPSRITQNGPNLNDTYNQNHRVPSRMNQNRPQRGQRGQQGQQGQLGRLGPFRPHENQNSYNTPQGIWQPHPSTYPNTIPTQNRRPHLESPSSSAQVPNRTLPYHRALTQHVQLPPRPDFRQPQQYNPSAGGLLANSRNRLPTYVPNAANGDEFGTPLDGRIALQSTLEQGRIIELDDEEAQIWANLVPVPATMERVRNWLDSVPLDLAELDTISSPTLSLVETERASQVMIDLPKKLKRKKRGSNDSYTPSTDGESEGMEVPPSKKSKHKKRSEELLGHAVDSTTYTPTEELEANFG